MEKKIGVYICEGCGIGESLDMEALEKVATEEGKAAVCRRHKAFCSEEGLEIIKKDISDGVNALIIAACSPRVMTDVFSFENCILERVNLREQVAWIQEPKNEDTQMMAEDYLRMALVKVKNMELPVPYIPEEEVSKDILVVGGGVAGLSAAIEGAKAGYNIILVEKEKELGGFQRKVKKIATMPYKDIKDNDIDRLIEEVTKNERIKVYTGARIESTEGGPGIFKVKINQDGKTVEHKIGAIVVAAGWVPYDPEKLDPKYGYGKSPKVITSVQFEERQKEGLKNVAFIQCVGQRDPNHLPYCSTFCCIASLKQAIEIKQNDPEANVYIVFREMRTPGHEEDLYRRAQELGVIFIRSQQTEVKVEGNKVSVVAKDEILGEDVILEDLDLVVLATGAVPVSAFGEEIIQEKIESEGEEIEVPPDLIRRSNILNLQYRQGPEMPALKYDFPDSHFICFPYETRRTGIYAAGCIRRPMGIDSAKDDGAGAMMKAIQCVERTAKGQVVHPRTWEKGYLEIDLSRCTQCKRCTVECPFGAINEDEKANPIPIITRCRRCATCMGACPQRIISFKDYSVSIIGEMLRAIEVPEDEEKLRILVFACENDAYPALDMAGQFRLKVKPWIRVIPLRCLGSLNLVWIADALSRGIDGVLLLGCKHGDDYQCHFVKGSELANIRLSKISETLERLALEPERVKFEIVAIDDYPRIPEMIESFVKTIEEIGPNPFKGW